MVAWSKGSCAAFCLFVSLKLFSSFFFVFVSSLFECLLFVFVFVWLSCVGVLPCCFCGPMFCFAFGWFITEMIPMFV